MSATAAGADQRRIPGDVEACEACGAPIVWTTTLAGPNGPGGKAMAVNPREDLAYGNTAVRPEHRGRLLARVLFKGERHDAPLEYLAVPHVATCPYPAGFKR
jgi:hypothetical protein